MFGSNGCVLIYMLRGKGDVEGYSGLVCASW